MKKSPTDRAAKESVAKPREDAIPEDDAIAELNFSDDYPEPSFQNLLPEVETAEEEASAHNLALSGEATEDDLAPEILIKENGALSPREAGDDRPADQLLRIVAADKIGAGRGLDEADLAKLNPPDSAVGKKNLR